MRRWLSLVGIFLTLHLTPQIGFSPLQVRVQAHVEEIPQGAEICFFVNGEAWSCGPLERKTTTRWYRIEETSEVVVRVGWLERGKFVSEQTPAQEVEVR